MRTATAQSNKNVKKNRDALLLLCANQDLPSPTQYFLFYFILFNQEKKHRLFHKRDM